MRGGELSATAPGRLGEHPDAVDGDDRALGPGGAAPEDDDPDRVGARLQAVDPVDGEPGFPEPWGPGRAPARPVIDPR